MTPPEQNVSERLQTFNKIRKNLVTQDKKKWGVESTDADYSVGNLTPDLYKLADLFGVKVVGFKYNGKDPKMARRAGISTPDGIAINANSRDQFLTIFGHEVYHNLAKRDKAAAADLEQRVLSYINEEGKQGLRTKLETIGYSPEKMNEETVADVMGFMFQDPQFWQQLGQEKPGLLQKVIRVIDDMIRRFGGLSARSDELSLYITEMDTVRDMMSEFVTQALDKQQQTQEVDEAIEIGPDPVAQFRELATAGNKAAAAKVFNTAKLRPQLGDFNQAYEAATKAEPQPVAVAEPVAPAQPQDPLQNAVALAKAGNKSGAAQAFRESRLRDRLGVDFEAFFQNPDRDWTKDNPKLQRQAAIVSSRAEFLRRNLQMTPEQFAEVQRLVGENTQESIAEASAIVMQAEPTDVGTNQPRARQQTREEAPARQLLAPMPTQQTRLDMTENPAQVRRYAAEAERLMLTAFTPDRLNSTLEKLRAQLDELYAAKNGRKQSDVEYIFDAFEMAAEAPGEARVAVDEDSGMRQEYRGGDRQIEDLREAIKRAQTRNVTARAGLLKVHAKSIEDSLVSLRERMVEAGVSEQAADEIIQPKLDSIRAIQQTKEPEQVQRQVMEVSPEYQDAQLTLPSSDFGDARRSAAAAVDEIINSNTSPLAIIRRELNKPDREFSFSDLRKEMAARGLDVSQIDREVAQWPAAQYALDYWVMKNRGIMNPYAARTAWFNSYENIMAIYKDEPALAKQYEDSLSDVEKRFISTMRDQRRAVKNRRNETLDQMGNQFVTPQQAFPHALFNKYRLDDMRNLDESAIPEEEAAVLRSLVGGNTSFLPRLWLDDVAYAIDARKDLRPQIFESMTDRERNAVEKYLQISATTLANNQRISALRSYSSMLEEIGGLSKEQFAAFTSPRVRQMVYSDERAIPKLLHRAQQVADIASQAKNKKELGDMLSAYLDAVYKEDANSSQNIDEAEERFNAVQGGRQVEVTDDEVDSHLEQLNRQGEVVDRDSARADLLMQKAANEAVNEILTGEVVEQEVAALPSAEPQNQAGLSGDIQYKRGANSSGPAAEVVRARIAEITYSWKNKPNVQVYYNVDQIKDPELHARLTARAESGSFKGAIDTETGAVYIFSEYVDDVADAEFVMFHELYGHYGLRAFLGDKLNAFLENQYRLNKKVKAEADRQFEEAKDTDAPMSRIESIEEAISDMAANGEPSLFRQLIGQLVRWLRKHDMGAVADWIDSTGHSELAYILSAARRVVRNGEGIAPLNGTPASVLYSRNKMPIEVFATRDGKVTGYARMNPVNQYWTVFTVQDIATGNFSAVTVEDLSDVTAILKKVGTLSKSRDRDTRVDIDPNNLEQIPDYNDLKGWKKFTRNLQIKTQNMFLPVFEVARFLESKGFKNAVIDDIVKYEARLGNYVNDFEKRFLNPISRALSEAGKKGATVEDVDLFLMARHAAERNDSIFAINPENRSGSGMTTDEAQAALNKYLAVPYAAELEQIGQMVDQMSRDKLNYMLQTNLINKFQYESLSRYKHYVNLSGNEKLGLDAFDSKMLGGKSFNLRGTELIRSTGRGTKAIDVLQNTMNAYMSTLIRGQKNRVTMSILQMFERNPDPTYLTIEPIKEIKKVNVERLSFDKKILRVIGDSPDEGSGRALLRGLQKQVESGAIDTDDAMAEITRRINEAEQRRDIEPVEAMRAISRISESVVLSARLSPDGYVTMVEDPNLMRDDSVLVAKSNGRPVVMRFNKRAGEFIQAISGMNVQETNGFVEAIGKWNRFFSQMVTTWNPAWLPINFMRDIQTAFANAAADPEVGAELANKMRKEWMPALKAAWRYNLREQKELKGKHYDGKLDPKWDQLIKDFFEDGAATFFLDRKGLEQTLDKINRHLNGPRGALENTQQFFEVIGDAMDLLATPTELAPRLAAYKVLREAGRSREEAARYAKELTVNFNAKGSSKELRALYVFANPAIQGTYRLFKDYSRADSGIGKYLPSNRFAAVAGAWMMLGMVTNYIARALGGEDEERPGIDQLDTIPGFKRATSLVVMPNALGGSIPVAYGWNIFSTAGTYMFDVMTGRMKPEVAATRVMSTTFDSLSPLGSGAESQTLTGTLWKTFSPSPFVPLIDLALNENRFGAPIHKGNNPFSDIKESNAYMHFDSVNPISRSIMRGLADATSTGNARYSPGLIDVNPGVVDYLISSYLPGLFSEVYKTAGLAIQKAQGRDTRDMPIPIVDRFKAKTPDGFDAGAMRRVAEEVETKYKEYMSPATSDARRAQLDKQYPGLGSVKSVVSSTDQMNKRMSQNLQAIESDPTLSNKEKVEYRNQIQEMRKQYNKQAVQMAVEGGFKDEIIDNRATGILGRAAERLRD